MRNNLGTNTVRIALTSMENICTNVTYDNFFINIDTP